VCRSMGGGAAFVAARASVLYCIGPWARGNTLKRGKYMAVDDAPVIRNEKSHKRDARGRLD
jgi:hypothetical protein